MEQTVKLEVSVNELNIILAGLGELPLKHSGQLVGKLQTAAAEQLGVVQQLPDAKPQDE